MADSAVEEQEPSREEWLRNSFEFAYVTQFLSLFYFAFGLESFSYHDVESLLLWEPDQVTGATTKFFKKILKALPNARITSTDNWLHVLGKEYRKHGFEKPFEEEILVAGDGEDSEQPPPPPKELQLSDIELKVKVQILYDLCEFHLRHGQYFFETLLKGADAGAHWRIEPIGRDFNGHQYWLFDDGRLFREETESKSSIVGVEGTWRLVCDSLEGWKAFLESELSSKPADRKLKEALEEQWPSVEEVLLEQEKIAKEKARNLALLKQTHDLYPRKRSSRLQAREAMQKLREQEEAEERRVSLNSRRSAADHDIYEPSYEAPKGALGASLKMSREERAEQRRLRTEREAQEKILEELEAERRLNEPEQEVEVEKVDEEAKVNVREKLKIFIRRSSLGSVPEGNAGPPKQAPEKKPRKEPKKAPKVDPQQQKVLSLMEQAIQRELANRSQQQQQQPPMVLYPHVRPGQYPMMPPLHPQHSMQPMQQMSCPAPPGISQQQFQQMQFQRQLQMQQQQQRLQQQLQMQHHQQFMQPQMQNPYMMRPMQPMPQQYQQHPFPPHPQQQQPPPMMYPRPPFMYQPGPQQQPQLQQHPIHTHQGIMSPPVLQPQPQRTSVSGLPAVPAMQIIPNTPPPLDMHGQPQMDVSHETGKDVSQP